MWKIHVGCPEPHPRFQNVKTRYRRAVLTVRMVGTQPGLALAEDCWLLRTGSLVSWKVGVHVDKFTSSRYEYATVPYRKLCVESVADKTSSERVHAHSRDLRVLTDTIGWTSPLSFRRHSSFVCTPFAYHVQGERVRRPLPPQRTLRGHSPSVPNSKPCHLAVRSERIHQSTVLPCLQLDDVDRTARLLLLSAAASRL